MKLTSKLLALGTHKNNSKDLNWRIRITNGVTIFLVVLSALFFVNAVTQGGDPKKPLIGLGIIVSVLILNALKRIDLSRIILSVLPSLLLTIMHLSVLMPGSHVFYTLYSFQFALSFIPWLVFSNDRKWVIYSLSFVNLLLLLSFKWDLAFSVKYNSYEHFELGALGYIAGIGAFGILSGLFNAVNYLNNKQARANKQLIGDMQQTQVQMEEKTQRLNETIAQIEKAKAEDEKRQWFNDGITKVNELIREDQDPDQLKDRLISFIVRYTKANQGAIFELKQQDDHRFLKMTACYAYQRKKYIHKTIEIGEGLAGQCVLEADFLYLTDVPDDYVNITSGLGKALPKAVAIVPLLNDEKVEGVVEIASFEEFDDFEKDFLLKAGSSLAAFLVSERISRRTQELLNDSQSKAEQLRTQEEEMRQNMEEMVATQEELKRKQRQFEKALQDKEEEARMWKRRFEQAVK